MTSTFDPARFIAHSSPACTNCSAVEPSRTAPILYVGYDQAEAHLKSEVHRSRAAAPAKSAGDPAAFQTQACHIGALGAISLHDARKPAIFQLSRLSRWLCAPPSRNHRDYYGSSTPQPPNARAEACSKYSHVKKIFDLYRRKYSGLEHGAGWSSMNSEIGEGVRGVRGPAENSSTAVDSDLLRRPASAIKRK
ncbi:hypothetical protein CEXT_333931 [Caerostris extrusa]|uniref:Uncharacterized protein n=1 Tax=Caerostris extrusa TaxID=172846 RepID=A0AAV4XXE5_CAEEX|nr:hypothetical protein CEXT_333931 [Caerostris extrusa]